MRKKKQWNKVWPIGLGILIAVVAIAVGICLGIIKQQNESTDLLPEATTLVDPSNITTSGNTTLPTGIVTPDANNVLCQRGSVFTGPYVEDGKDAPVSNVAAILVTNPTERYLDLASIVYEIDGVRATFKATGLPPGKSAWVMESSKLTVDPGAEFRYIDQYTVYRDAAISFAEELTIRSEGSKLQVTNNTENTLENVFVYYKTKYKDGNYLGGITYAVNFGTIMSGQTVEQISGHYKEENTEIVNIGWQSGVSE